MGWQCADFSIHVIGNDNYFLVIVSMMKQATTMLHAKIKAIISSVIIVLL
jgi:hypothetical protein